MMDVQSLRALADFYPPSDRASLFDLATRYQARREQEILDIAAVAADVSADSILNLGLEPEINPLLMQALRLQYPNVDPTSLVGALPERLSGIANGVKGKYFEVLVMERLNAGQKIGELALAPEQLAQLADSPTQAGWDLQIVDSEDGSVVEVLQLKATTDMSYVKEALEKYPNIRIATPSDIDGAAEEILQTNISHQELAEEVHRHVAEVGEGTATDVLHQTSEWIFDAVPIIPAILIGVTEGRAVLLGRSTWPQALRRGATRLKRSAAFSTIGATWTAIDAGVLSIPITTAARIAWARVVNRTAMGEFVYSKTQELRLLTAT